MKAGVAIQFQVASAEEYVQKVKQFGKQVIAALPAPVSLRVMDVMMWLLHAKSREFFRMQRQVYEKLGRPTQVMEGPFRNMPYISRASSSCLLPKFIGMYEVELQPAIEQIISADCDVIVDIGSAEGYYAVGLARRLPAARIVCYDILKRARYLLGTLAKKNNLAERIDQRSACTPSDLQEALAPASRPAVICDCEGAEDFLLLPDQTPELKRAIMLVELHELMRPGVTERIRSRFNSTHEIQVIDGIEHPVEPVCRQFRLTPTEARFAMDEHRDDQMQWFFMLPKHA